MTEYAPPEMPYFSRTEIISDSDRQYSLPVNPSWEQADAGRLDIDFANSATSGRNMAQDFETGATWEKHGLFYGWNQKVKECLSVAYSIYLHLIVDRNEAAAELSKYPPFKGRLRKVKAGSEACNAVQLVAKPNDESERKLCSEHSYVLIWAEQHRVPPEEFSTRVASTTLKMCIHEVREGRKKSKLLKSKVVTQDKDEAPRAQALEQDIRAIIASASAMDTVPTSRSRIILTVITENGNTKSVGAPMSSHLSQTLFDAPELRSVWPKPRRLLQKVSSLLKVKAGSTSDE